MLKWGRTSARAEISDTQLDNCWQVKIRNQTFSQWNWSCELCLCKRYFNWMGLGDSILVCLSYLLSTLAIGTIRFNNMNKIFEIWYSYQTHICQCILSFCVNFAVWKWRAMPEVLQFRDQGRYIIEIHNFLLVIIIC